MALELYDTLPIAKSDDEEIAPVWAKGAEKFKRYAEDPDAANMHLFLDSGRRFFGLGTEPGEGGAMNRVLWQFGNGPRGPGKTRVLSVPESMFSEPLNENSDLATSIPTWMQAFQSGAVGYPAEHFEEVDTLGEDGQPTGAKEWKLKNPIFGTLYENPVVDVGFNYSKYKNKKEFDDELKKFNELYSGKEQ